jgi:hypothetical protein
MLRQICSPEARNGDQESDARGEIGVDKFRLEDLLTTPIDISIFLFELAQEGK